MPAPSCLPMPPVPQKPFSSAAAGPPRSRLSTSKSSSTSSSPIVRCSNPTTILSKWLLATGTPPTSSSGCCAALRATTSTERPTTSSSSSSQPKQAKSVAAPSSPGLSAPAPPFKSAPPSTVTCEDPTPGRQSSARSRWPKTTGWRVGSSASSAASRVRMTGAALSPRCTAGTAWKSYGWSCPRCRACQTTTTRCSCHTRCAQGPRIPS